MMHISGRTLNEQWPGQFYELIVWYFIMFQDYKLLLPIANDRKLQAFIDGYNMIHLTSKKQCEYVHEWIMYFVRLEGHIMRDLDFRVLVRYRF